MVLLAYPLEEVGKIKDEKDAVDLARAFYISTRVRMDFMLLIFPSRQRGMTTRYPSLCGSRGVGDWRAAWPGCEVGVADEHGSPVWGAEPPRAPR